jgi:hypothetical protein
MPKTHAGARWSISDGQLPLPQLKLSSKVQLWLRCPQKLCRSS